MWVQCECNPNTCICENSRYLKSIADTLIILCDEIINGTDSVSTNVANTISTNVMSTVWINFDDKNVTCEKSNYSHYFISNYMLVNNSCHFYQFLFLL